VVGSRGANNTIVRYPNIPSLSFPRHAVPRPGRINPPHQFFRKLEGFIEGRFSRRRRFPVSRQSPTQENRRDNAKRALPSNIHFGKIAYSLYLLLERRNPSGKGTGSGEIKEKMVFNRKDYG
jgi:hypothetical protein